MTNNKNIIIEFVTRLCEAEGLMACFDVLTESIRNLEFDGILYANLLLRLAPGGTPESILITSDSYSDSFIDHYVYNHLIKDNFIVRAMDEKHVIVLDWMTEGKTLYLRKTNKGEPAPAPDHYHIYDCETIPTLGSNTELSRASIVIEERRHRDSQRLQDNLPIAEQLIKLFHNRIHSDKQCKRILLDSFLSRFNKRELEVLKFVSTGLPMKVISDHCGISPGYANNMLDELYKKFGVRNRNQLRYNLGLYRIVDVL